MTRIINAGNAVELAKNAVRICIMADLDFPSGHLYLNDGMSEVTFGGHVYNPLGKFAGINVVEEQLDTLARPIQLILSGVDASVVGSAQNETYQNRSVIVYFGLLDQQTGIFVSTPETAWEGRMDYMTIAIDAGVGKITLNCEHRLRREPRIARYTDTDQQTAHTGDTFFNFINTLVGFKSQWGNEKMVYSGPARPNQQFKYPWPYFGGAGGGSGGYH